MKTREKKNLQEKTIAELTKMVTEAKDTLFENRLEFLQGKLKNTAALRKKRRDIAQLMSILQAKELNNENV